MGQIFSQLTQPNSALINPNGSVAQMGNPSQMRDMDFKASSAQHPYLPGTTNPNAPVATAQTPTFQQAASYGATPGGANALSPGLTKAGKLATLLQSGLQGALAGRAKSEETVAETGGRRSGGAGMGFEAGYTLPWQREAQQNQLAQQQAQTALTKSQSDMVPTQYGPMPAALARYILPAQIKGGAQVESAGIGAQGRIGAAEIGQRFKAVPGVGLFDTNSRQVIPGTSQNITITPEIAKDYQLPDEFVGKPLGVSQLATLERAQSYQNVLASGAEGPSLVNRNQASPNFGKATPLGLGSPAMGGVVPVAADPNNPGNITYAPKRQAVGMTAPSSALPQAARAEAKAEVPTKIGDQKVAFTTMIQHAELLRDAAKALQNGDVQSLAGLKNAFKNEFGYSGPITAKAIADAYGGEVTNVISKGHITDAEMAKTGKTLDPSKQNFATIDRVLNAYQALAQSKMNMLTQQANAASGKTGTPKGGGKANDPLAIRP